MAESRRRQLERTLAEYRGNPDGGGDGAGDDHARVWPMGPICSLSVHAISVSGAGATVLSYVADDEMTAPARALVHASNPVSAALEDLQLTVGEGPCLDAFDSGGPVLVPDLTSTTRWPGFTPGARELGAAAVYSFPLQIGVVRLGSIDLYRDQPGALSRTELSDALILADTLVADFDVLDFLGLLAERAAELLDISAAGVILSDQRGGWRITAGSSERAELVDLFAAQALQGPCVECLRAGAPVSSPDLAAEEARWPQFSEAAIQAGFHAAYAVPMRLRDETIGALTMLNETTARIDENSARIGQALADVATIGILQHRAVSRGEILSEQLQATLHWRTVVEQAKGVLAEHGDLSMADAYTLLRDFARAHHGRLSDVAKEIADGTTDVNQLLAYREQLELS